MDPILKRFIVLIVAVALTAPASVAQDSSDSVPSQREDLKLMNPFEGMDQTQQKLQTVRSLMRQRDYQNAAALLETMWADNPEDISVYNLLKSCYSQLKLHEKMLGIVEPRVEAHPDNYAWRLDLAQTLAHLNQRERAGEEYSRAVSLAPTERELGRALEGMVGAGFDSTALRLIDSLIPLVNDPNPILFQRGRVLEKQKQFGRAAVEYFALLADTTRLGSEAERRLLDLLKFEESSAIVEEQLMSRADTVGNTRALRLLLEHYLASGDPERGFSLAIRSDSLEGGQGRALVHYLVTCQERKMYEPAARMGRYILDNYDSGPTLTPTWFALGEVLTALGRYDEAQAVYDTAYAHLPRSRDRSEVLVRIGKLCLDYRNDPGCAISYLDSVVQHHASGIGYLEALRLRPQTHLRLGDLDRAEALFDELSDKRLNELAHEEIDYYRGLIHFYRKEYDSARADFKALIVRYSDGFYVNDALHLMTIMERAQDSDELLYDYSNALFFEQRRMYDSMATALEKLVSAPSPALSDLALYRLSDLALQQADTGKALEHVERMAEKAPESYYYPFGLKLKADVLSRRNDPESVEQARQIYRTLLTEHANYPFASEVRQSLRALDREA